MIFPSCALYNHMRIRNNQIQLDAEDTNIGSDSKEVEMIAPHK